MRLIELDLLAIVFDRFFHEIFKRIVSRACTAGDIGSELLQLLEDCGIARHEVGILSAIVFVDETDNLTKIFFGKGIDIVLSLDVDVHNGMASEFFEDIFKGGNLETREFCSVLHAEIVAKQFFIRIFPNSIVACGYAAEPRIVGGNDRAVLCCPKVKLDFMRAEGDRCTECGHAVFGRDGIEASVCAHSGVCHDLIVTNDRASAGTVFPRSASCFYVVVMRCGRIAEACSFQIALMRIEFRASVTDVVFHIQKHLSVGSGDQAATADGRIRAEADGGANDVSIGVISAKSCHDLKRIVAVASLICASDDNLGVISCDIGKCLIEIEVVTNQEAVTNAVDFQNGGLTVFPSVILVEFIYVHFGGNEVLLGVRSGKRAVLAECNGGIAKSRRMGIDAVDENRGSATLGGFGSLIQQCFAVFFIAFFHFCFGFCETGDVGILGQNDDIHRFVAFVKLSKLPCEKCVGFREIQAVSGLNNTYFHFDLRPFF